MSNADLTRVRVDDRHLEVVTAGPPDAHMCVVHGGTPSAALTFGPTQDAVVGHGLRYLTYSRPGYAGSDPLPGRSVADAAGVAPRDAEGLDWLADQGAENVEEFTAAEKDDATFTT